MHTFELIHGGFRRLLVLGALSVAPLGGLAGQDTGSLAGRVVNADGEPVSDADVRIMELGRRVSVKDSGTFGFDALPPGEYLVEATSLRSGHKVERFQVLAGEATSIVLELDPLFRLDELVVSAGPAPARRSETYQPTSSLTGWDLVEAMGSSLGETLAGEPGVVSSYNGPGASRPIIRGLGGDRVRILEAGVGSGDVSNQGPDHAVAVEPTLAERIEIVRGPATLLYGSSAVGGVVNVLDTRIPREKPEGALTGSLMALGGTVADERTGSLTLEGALGSSLAWHLSGLHRSTDDYAIPGFAEVGEDHDEGHEEEGHAEEEEYGILENSALETTRGAVGLSWLGRAGYLGVSVSGLAKEYGVPGHGDHHGHEGEEHEQEGEEAPDVTIDLDQRRLDLEGSWRLGSGGLKGLRGRFGYADYEHEELEGTEVGTRFTNEEWEGRVELQHTLFRALDGSVGLQMRSRDFAASGEEAYVPPSESTTFAAFLFEELAREAVRYQVGARIEGQRVRQLPLNREESHLGFSLSGGLNWTLRDQVTLAVSGSRSVKLPTLEELFSDGPHAATFAYEIGNPELDPETAYSLDATFRVTGDLVRGEVTGFTNLFADFIYQNWTGREEDGLPVLEFRQADASFVGAEAAMEMDLVHRGRHHLLLTGWGDYVRATLRDGDEPLPRIPPLRLGGGVHYDGGVMRAEVGLTRVTSQDRISTFEEETEGYTMLSASLGYRLFAGDLVHDLVLRGKNLTDTEARNHTSFLKDLAPLPGREISLVYRVHF